MPTLLAIDSSGDVFSTAISTADGEAACMQSDGKQPHATCALPLVQALLDKHDLTLDKCDAYAFAAGPGKFSALRLVCAVARAFAYACNKPLLAVPSFAALAQANYGNAPMTVKCALPAHQQHVYFGVCRNEEGRWRVRHAAVRRCTGGILRADVRHACGAGYRQYPQLLGAAAYCERAAYSTAATVLPVALHMWEDGETSEPLTCEPIYLRRKVAQTIYQRQCKQTS